MSPIGERMKKFTFNVKNGLPFTQYDKGSSVGLQPGELYPCVCLSIYLFFSILPILPYPINNSKGCRGGKFKNIRPCSESVTSQTPGNQVYSSAMSFAKSNTTLSPYHASTKEMGVEIFKMYNRIKNQQPQKHLSNKFYPYHHLIKFP